MLSCGAGRFACQTGMFERYTEKARRVIFFGRYEASQFGASYIETEHILLGLLREDKALANRFLGSYAGIESIRKQIETHTPAREKVSTSIDMPLSDQSKRVLSYGAEEAERLGHKHISTDHLLLGLLREESGYAAQLLRERALTADGVRKELAQDLASEEQADTIWRQHSRDLTQAAADGKLDPPVGLDPVVNHVIEILWRRSKNSPVLITDDVALSTAVVERLAVRIHTHEVPAFFHDWRVLAVDISRIADIGRAPKRIIGTRSETVFLNGPLERILSISRATFLMNRMQCICVGSMSEYLKWIDADPLLKPHFEPVELPPPSAA